MTSSRTYVPAADAMSAELEGEAVILHLGTRRYYRLNETAATVWAALESGIDTPNALAARLCECFDVELAVAGAEVDRLLAELEAHGLVRPAGGA